MQESSLTERLRRLIQSDMCDAENVEEHQKELLELAQFVAPPGELKQQTRFFKALADEKRLQILKLLGIREMCVCELSIALNVSQPNLSHHLKILENEDIVSRRKKGKWVFYSIIKNPILEILLQF
ncbi:MAG: ArsR/SmtB family transcription factor [Candidatus Ranarchaeia archaeon]